MAHLAFRSTCGKHGPESGHDMCLRGQLHFVKNFRCYRRQIGVLRAPNSPCIVILIEQWSSADPYSGTFQSLPTANTEVLLRCGRRLTTHCVNILPMLSPGVSLVGIYCLQQKKIAALVHSGHVELPPSLAVQKLRPSTFSSYIRSM